MRTSSNNNKDVQTHVAEVMETLTDMLQWGGEFSFIDETRYCCGELSYQLESNNEYLSFLIEGEYPPETSFAIFNERLNVWAN
jgi:hypothetical protein